MNPNSQTLPPWTTSSHHLSFNITNISYSSKVPKYFSSFWFILFLVIVLQRKYCDNAILSVSKASLTLRKELPQSCRATNPDNLILSFFCIPSQVLLLSHSYSPVHPPIHWHAYPSIHPFTYKSTYSSNSTVDGWVPCLVVQLCTICCSYIHLSIYLSIHIITHQSIYSFIHWLSICPSIHSATNSLPSHPFNDPRIHLPIHPSSHLPPNHLLIYSITHGPTISLSMSDLLIYTFWWHSDPILIVSPETRMVIKSPWRTSVWVGVIISGRCQLNSSH